MLALEISWSDKLKKKELAVVSSQRRPVNDAAQPHLKPLTIAMHVPPFRHGLLEHSVSKS